MDLILKDRYPVETKLSRYLIIGGGRLARHFAHYLSLLEIPFERWSRSESLKELIVKIARAERVLLLISDSAIESFAKDVPALEKKICIHCSGSMVIDGIPSCHPLMTFGDELYDLKLYKSIAFICESESKAFNELLPGLANPHAAIPRADKPLYHALCVLSGNFTSLLWSKFFGEFGSRWGLPSDLIYPYLRQVANNLTHQGANALTGPFVRHDWQTIERNIRALEDDPYREVYEAFARVYFGPGFHSKIELRAKSNCKISSEPFTGGGS